jgi:hypothetical protein
VRQGASVCYAFSSLFLKAPQRSAVRDRKNAPKRASFCLKVFYTTIKRIGNIVFLVGYALKLLLRFSSFYVINLMNKPEEMCA